MCQAGEWWSKLAVALGDLTLRCFQRHKVTVFVSAAAFQIWQQWRKKLIRIVAHSSLFTGEIQGNSQWIDCMQAKPSISNLSMLDCLCLVEQMRQLGLVNPWNSKLRKVHLILMTRPSSLTTPRLVSQGFEGQQGVARHDTSPDTSVLVSDMLGTNKPCAANNSFLHDCSFDVHKNAQGHQLECALQGYYSCFGLKNLRYRF